MNKNLSRLSDDELLEELKKRKIDEALSIDEKINNLKPQLVDNPDTKALTKLCQDYINNVMKDCVDHDDMPHWFEEEAMKAFMGKDVWKKISEINKLLAIKRKIK